MSWFSGSKVLALACLLTLAFTGSAVAQGGPVGLGTADSFAILAGSAVTNTGPSVVTGDVGVSPGSSVGDFSGLPEGTIFGTTYVAGAAAGAKSALSTAYTDAENRNPPIPLTSADLSDSGVLTPGVYNASSSLGLTGNVTLNGLGNPNAVFIFQVGDDLTTATDSSVTLIGNTQACNVYWQIGTSATLNTRTSFMGTIMAADSITLNDAVVVQGRLLAQTAAVTLINDRVTRPTCAAATTPPPGSTPPGSTPPVGTPAGTAPGADRRGPSVLVLQLPGVRPRPPARPGARRPGRGSVCTKTSFTASVRLRDGSGIRRVKVYLDGRLVRTTSRSRFNLRVNVRGLRVGSHRITVVARDRAGNRSVTTRRFGRCALQVAAPRFTG